MVLVMPLLKARRGRAGAGQGKAVVTKGIRNTGVFEELVGKLCNTMRARLSRRHCARTSRGGMGNVTDSPCPANRSTLGSLGTDLQYTFHSRATYYSPTFLSYAKLKGM